MKARRALIALGFFFACVAGIAAEQAGAGPLVRVGPDGHLVYRAYSPEGDRLPDFSYAGYRGGEPLPEVPVVRRLTPVAGDNRARVQAALDELARRTPDAHGFRGALLLESGRYEIGDSLRIIASGIVLRGAGEDAATGTVLVATKRARHALIRAGGTGTWQEDSGSSANVIDEYVPVGARSFRVDRPERFRVGDRVIVRRPSTAEWIDFIGMNRIPPRPDGGRTTQWKPGTMDLKFDRTIVAIDGDRIGIDVPLTNALQRRFGGGQVSRYDFPQRRQNIGVENLRIESEFDPSLVADYREGEAQLRGVAIDEAHGWNAVEFDAVENAWAQHVTSVHFGNACVYLGPTALRVTVSRCACLDDVSRITGSRRYAFSIAGQLGLVRDCYVRHARHAFVLGARVPGPNVFLDCRAEECYAGSEPHHRWSAGGLWDNVTVDGPSATLQAVNRGWMGTGHGWAGAQMVFWNCSAALIAVQRPPTAQNFAIGVTRAIPRPALVASAVRTINHASGRNLPPSAPFWGDGYREHADGPVAPRSLYLAQLAERRRAN